ncbi:Vmc-like lipoprotein signal peptide domain-containing protein [Saccharopolyspora sp. NPDC002376]
MNSSGSTATIAVSCRPRCGRRSRLPLSRLGAGLPAVGS